MAKKAKKETLQETLQKILKAENAAYEKAGIVRHFIVSFPNRQKSPLLGQIGVKLIAMAGGVIQFQYTKRDNK